MKKPYLFKDYYHIDSYLYYDEKIPLYINERTVTFQMYSSFDKLFSKEYYLFCNKRKGALEVSINFEETELHDGYTLDICKNHIIIKASNERGVLYAIDVLNALPENKCNKVALPIVLIEDKPSFKYRGIIEGYYGTQWTYNERIEMFDFMQEHRLNTYIYAPKTDIYHREHWCDLYPEKEITQIFNLVNKAIKTNIDFWYTISPGFIKEGLYAFNYKDEKDFQRLFNKIDQLINVGINNFGLLLDDIDYKLSQENKIRFNRPGIAHAYICNRMFEYVKTKVKSAKFVMCPTEYHQIGETQYRSDLRENLNDEIKVFFTGDNVCAEVITESDMSLTKKAYNKPLFIWDNFPVSDFKYGVREYIGPIKNRCTSMNKYAEGYFINPSIHYQISKVAMITMADFAWNICEYNQEIKYKKALNEISEEFYSVSKEFIEFNYPSVLSYGNIEKHHHWILNKEYEKILQMYENLKNSAEEMLKLDLPIIDELKPWLEHAISEEKIASKIISKKVNKSDLLAFLKDKHFLGSEIIDELIAETNLLSKEEYNELIIKRRGPLWYRVFEEKRWKK